MTTKAEENAAQDPKRVSEPESDIGRLVAARDRDLKDARERNVIDAPYWSDLISTEDAVLDALETVEKEEEDEESSDSDARHLRRRRS